MISDSASHPVPFTVYETEPAFIRVPTAVLRPDIWIERCPIWDVELFGGLRLVRGVLAQVRFRSHKTASLLGYLAYHRGSWHPKSLLAERFGGDEFPEEARRSFDAALRALRLELEPSWIPAGAVLLEDERNVCLSAGAVGTDVAEFRERITRAQQCRSRLRRVSLLSVAVEQYRPDLMAGYSDEWLLLAQSELDELYLSAAQMLVKDLAAVGDLSEALRIASGALAVDPRCVELHRQTVRLFERMDNQPAAMRHAKEAGNLLGVSLETSRPRTCRASRDTAQCLP